MTMILTGTESNRPAKKKLKKFVLPEVHHKMSGAMAVPLPLQTTIHLVNSAIMTLTLATKEEASGSNVTKPLVTKAHIHGYFLN